MAKHVAGERKATTIIRQTDSQESSQSNAYVERAHQSVEAMVRTMKEVIEDEAQTKLSATQKHHELDDSTRSILATCVGVPAGQSSGRDRCTGTGPYLINARVHVLR